MIRADRQNKQRSANYYDNGPLVDTSAARRSPTEQTKLPKVPTEDKSKRKTRESRDAEVLRPNIKLCRRDSSVDSILTAADSRMDQEHSGVVPTFRRLWLSCTNPGFCSNTRNPDDPQSA